MKHSELVNIINKEAKKTENDSDSLVYAFKSYEYNHSNTIVQDKFLNLKDKEATYLHACCGLVTESAELLDLFKKKNYGKKVDFNKDKVKDELGDLFWYFWLLLKSQGLTIDEVLCYNISKLKERYSK